MSKEIIPNRLALCIMLADCNHMAGVLLDRIVFWGKHGRATIPKCEGYWVANVREFWQREACLSTHQYDRSIAKLKKLDLVEAKQWWWGRRNILHVRPTSKTVDYLTSAKSWQAAYEFFPEVPLEAASSFADPETSNSLNSNEFGIGEELSSAASLDSNNIENIHAYFISSDEKQTCALPASLACAASASGQIKSFGKDKQSKVIGTSKILDAALINGVHTVVTASIPTLQHLAEVWCAAVTKYFQVSTYNLTSKEKGLVAEYLVCLGDVLGGGGKNDFRPFAADIMANGVRNWGEIAHASDKTSGCPSVEQVCEEYLSEVITAWATAGRPQHDLGLK